MIILKELVIQDFLSHEKTSISFSDGQRVLIEGKSGSGKSSILDAIVWCLYGKGRVDGRNLIRQGCEKGSVEITLSEGNKEFLIKRRVSQDGKNFLAVEEMGDTGFTPIPVAGLKNIQDWIEKDLIKASFQLFINSVSYPQDNGDNFVKQTAAKRKDLLLEIASVENYDLLFERAKSRLQLTTEALQRFEGELAAVKLDIGGQEADLAKNHEELETQIGALVLQIKEKEEFLDAKRGVISEMKAKQGFIKTRQLGLEASEAEAKQIAARLLSTHEAINALSQVQKPEGSQEALFQALEKNQMDMAAFQEKLSNFRIKRSEIEALIRNKPLEQPFSQEIEKINKQIIQAMKDTMSLCDLGDACKNHQSVIKAKTSFLEEQLIDRSNRLAEQNKRLAEYSSKVRDLSDTMPPEPSSEELAVFMAKKNEIDSQLKAFRDYAEAEAKLTSLRIEEATKQNLLSEKEASLMSARAEIKALEQEISWFDSLAEETAFQASGMELISLRSKRDVLKASQVKIHELMERSKKQEARAKELEAEIAKIGRKKASLELIKEAFGSKGIKTLVIDILIPKLEGSINEILSQLSDFKVSLNTLKAAASGDGQIEGLFISIIDPQGKEMDFASYSGGEKLKIIVAISEALASLQRVGFRLLDELFVGLDEASTEGFLAVLEKIQGRFSQILCITHLQQIKDAFSDKLEVVKLNGVSQVV